MKLMSLLSREICLGWTGAAGIVIASIVHAQAVSVQVGVNFVESKNANATCFSKTVCYVVFSKVPRSAELLVTRVTCLFKTTANGVVDEFRLARNDGQIWTGVSANLVPVLTSAGPGRRRYFANNEVSLPYSAGQVPVVVLSVEDGTFEYVDCSISGTKPQPVAP